MSNRILLLSALAKGKTKVLNLLDSDDIRYMAWDTNSHHIHRDLLVLGEG